MFKSFQFLILTLFVLFSFSIQCNEDGIDIFSNQDNTITSTTNQSFTTTTTTTTTTTIEIACTVNGGPFVQYWGARYYYQYQFDKDGMLRYKIVKNKNIKFEYEYDSQKRLTKKYMYESTSQTKSKNPTGGHTTFTDEKTLINDYSYNNLSELTTINNYIYHDNGKLYYITTISFTYEHNNQNKISTIYINYKDLTKDKHEYYYEDGKLSRIEIYFLNEADYALNETIILNDNELIESHYYAHSEPIPNYIYDNDLRLISYNDVTYKYDGNILRSINDDTTFDNICEGSTIENLLNYHKHYGFSNSRFRACY